jgi:hypothetical protein
MRGKSNPATPAAAQFDRHRALQKPAAGKHHAAKFAEVSFRCRSDCEDMVISNVTILAPERAANTDAIDPSGHRILITKCKIDVGDDNIAIKAGKKIPGHGFSERGHHGDGLHVSARPRHEHRQRNDRRRAQCHVKNCTFENTENGIRIKSDTRRGGIVENISYSNITMSNVNPAITLTCIYQKSSAGDAKTGSDLPADPELDAPRRIPVFRNIHISNLTATCPKAAGLIQGLAENCISNVVLENVSISAAKSFEIRNAKGIQLKNVSVVVENGEPFKLDNAEVSGLSK